MLGVFVEFERAMIRERVMAGLARAKADGTRLGRPAAVADDAAKVHIIRAARAAGKSSVLSRMSAASVLGRSRALPRTAAGLGSLSTPCHTPK